MSRANREAALSVVAADPDLSPGARLLLIVIGDLVADDRNLEAGYSYLAGETGCNRSSVRRWRAELVTAGYLILEREVTGGHRANSYKLDFRLSPTTLSGGHLRHAEDASRVSSGGQEGVTHGPSGGHQGVTHDTKQQQQNRNSARSESHDAEFRRWAEERTKEKRGGPGLLRTILADPRDRATFEAERTRAAEREARATAIAGCDRCDEGGFVDVDENTRAQCTHPDLVREG